jgi:predicted nucleotidyltransferase
MGTGSDHDTLAMTLFGKNRRVLLGLLYGHVDEAFYLRQLVRACGGGVGAVQRELQQLERAGIVSRTRRGNSVYFQANRQCPVFEELRAIVRKTAGVVDILKSALASVADRIGVAILFGSLASGKEKSHSDADLLIVGEVSFAEIVTAIMPAQEELRREINPLVYPPEEFHAKIGAGHPFLNRVLARPVIFVIGGDDELERLAGKRLAHGTSSEP